MHTLDILTVAQPDGSIELVTLLYWGDCANGRSSHPTRTLSLALITLTLNPNPNPNPNH